MKQFLPQLPIPSYSIRPFLIVSILFLIFLSGMIGYFIGRGTDIAKIHIARQPMAVSPTNMSITKMTLSLTPTLNPMPMNWQTYIDATYGFSFKYPPNWILNPGRLIPNDRTLVFIVGGGNPKMDPVSISIGININNNNWTSKKWFTYIIARNNAPDLQYSYVTLGRYPAIKNTQTIAFEVCEIIAPVLHATTQNADYIIVFSNVGEGLTHSYALTDPFLQQSYADFQRVLASFSIPK